MQFRVPQNIDLEDKIVGPLTLRQFLFVLIGGVIDYILFQRLGQGHTLLALVIGVPIGLFALALAFLKIQDQPFGDFVIALFTFSTRPRQRIWHRADETPEPINQPKQNLALVKQRMGKKPLNAQELANLTKVLDSGGTVAPEQPSGNQMDIGRKRL